MLVASNWKDAPPSADLRMATVCFAVPPSFMLLAIAYTTVALGFEVSPAASATRPMPELGIPSGKAFACRSESQVAPESMLRQMSPGLPPAQDAPGIVPPASPRRGGGMAGAHASRPLTSRRELPPLDPRYAMLQAALSRPT